MAKRGRPRLPPRTDPDELRRSAEVAEDEFRRLLASIFPRLNRPRPPVELDQIIAALKPPRLLSEDERQEQLRRSRQAIEQAKSRRRPAKASLATQLRRIVPAPPKWVRMAAFESIVYLHREAPYMLRPTPRPEFGLVRDSLLKEGLAEDRIDRLLDELTYCAWAGGDIRDPGPNSTRAADIHYRNVMERIRAFAVTAPPPDVQHEVMLRLVIPAFNAAHSDRRLCGQCGRQFALRTDGERASEKMRFCSAKCRRQVSSRDAKRRARKLSGIYSFERVPSGEDDVIAALDEMMKKR